MMIDKAVLQAMIAGGESTHVVRDWMGVSHLPDGKTVTQVTLEPRDGSETFPGLTERIAEFVATDAVIGILGLMVDNQRKVVNLLIDEEKRNVSKEEHKS